MMFSKAIFIVSIWQGFRYALWFDLQKYPPMKEDAARSWIQKFIQNTSQKVVLILF